MANNFLSNFFGTNQNNQLGRFINQVSGRLPIANQIWGKKEAVWVDTNNAWRLFIEIPELRHLGYAEQCKRQAQVDGKEFVELEGSIELIEKLIFGEWPEATFLVVQPRQSIAGVYDMNQIVRGLD